MGVFQNEENTFLFKEFVPSVPPGFRNQSLKQKQLLTGNSPASHREQAQHLRNGGDSPDRDNTELQTEHTGGDENTRASVSG